MMPVVKYLKQTDKKIVTLNFIMFMVGLSIPISAAFNSISIGVLFLHSFVFFKKSNYNSLFKEGFHVHVLFLVYFLVQFLGVFYCDNLNIGLAYLIKNIVFLLLPIAFINLSTVLDLHKIKLAVCGLIVSVLLILISIYLNIFIQIFSDALSFKSLLTKFVRVDFVEQGFVIIHPPYFGILVVFALVSILNLSIIKNKIYQFVIKYGIAAFLIISLYGISSFMSVLLVFFLFFSYLIYIIIKGKTKIILTFLILIAVSITYIIKTDVIKTMKEYPGTSLIGRVQWSFINGKGDTSRPENWRSVALVVKDYLLFGIGSDGGIKHLQAHRKETSESFKNKHNAHNQYLETILRHGLLGLLVYLLMLYYIVLSAFKSKNFLFFSFIFIFMVSSITESYLVRQIGLTFFTFYALLYNTFYSFELFNKNDIT